MKEAAQTGLIIILSLLLLFHLLVLFKIIPYKIVWGSRLNTDADMYRFEIVSLILNVIFLVIILIKAKLLAINLPGLLINILLWAMVALFLLNTVGNLQSKNKTEKIIFTPITILLLILSILLALTNNW
jgi:hypothetical protein